MGSLPLTVLLDPSRLGASGLQEGVCARDDADADRTRTQDASLPGFHREFTAKEAEEMAASPMAREVAALQGQGYSCAEMSLLAALRFLGLPEEHVGSAGVFGGGVGKQDLCGFLTGNLMAFGLAAAARIPDRAERRRVARALSNEYWDWWITRGDIHCAILRPTYNGAEEFVRVGQRAALKAEQLLRIHLPA